MARTAYSQLLTALPYDADDIKKPSEASASSMSKHVPSKSVKEAMDKSPRHPYVYKVEGISFETAESH